MPKCSTKNIFMTEFIFNCVLEFCSRLQLKVSPFFGVTYIATFCALLMCLFSIFDGKKGSPVFAHHFPRIPGGPLQLLPGRRIKIRLLRRHQNRREAKKPKGPRAWIRIIPFFRISCSILEGGRLPLGLGSVTPFSPFRLDLVESDGISNSDGFRWDDRTIRILRKVR